ncbi:HAMP domain-containing protein [Paenibacillus mesophilus]|uniref:PP2C family protein-serine/threonine phosphatase n=1 Tax=Paenibacillus mesophilus TaxID=2582849 RepID=UPI00110DB263|nr:SpoIIE family protein phosphatase [Paenibacillus mesophilus]TMV47216.1 HAMP domain-containing protein [Paenibacillus mesophilus]
MIQHSLAGLYWRLFGVFVTALLVSCGFLTYNNIVILRISLSKLLAFNIPVIVSTSILFALILTAVTRWRLKPVWRELEGGGESGTKESATLRLWGLPSELFWWMMALTAFGCAFYHADALYDSILGVNGYGSRTLILILQNIMAEMMTGLTSAILFFVLLRRVAKRYLIMLHPSRLPAKAHGSFWHPLIWTYTSCSILVVFSVLRLLLQGSAAEIRFGWLAATFAIYFMFSFAVYRLLTKQFTDELRELTEGIRVLLQGNRARLHETVPVLSDDEVGQLSAAFNELQTIVAAKYEAVDRELALASEMQRQLLPGTSARAAAYTVVSRFKPAKEVGGDLYDIVSLDDSRTAVLVGDVSGKGMPAALLMSAALALFRSEIRAGGTAAEIITRLNRSLSDMLHGDMYVTLGLALFDASDSTVRYASAGHVAPYLIRAEDVLQIPVCSLPAGIDADETFEDTVLPFLPGDRLVLYTDGIVELTDEAGDMIGFDRFEKLLTDMDRDVPVEAQLEWLTRLLPEEGSPDEDDRTLLIIAMDSGGAI